MQDSPPQPKWDGLMNLHSVGRRDSATKRSLIDLLMNVISTVHF